MLFVLYAIASLVVDCVGVDDCCVSAGVVVAAADDDGVVDCGVFVVVVAAECCYGCISGSIRGIGVVCGNVICTVYNCAVCVVGVIDIDAVRACACFYIYCTGGNVDVGVVMVAVYSGFDTVVLYYINAVDDIAVVVTVVDVAFVVTFTLFFCFVCAYCCFSFLLSFIVLVVLMLMVLMSTLTLLCICWCLCWW